MIELVKEYIKILERIESSYPIVASEMLAIKERKDEIEFMLSKVLIDKDIKNIEETADILRDMRSTRHHISKLMEECGELISACAEYMFATEGEEFFDIIPQKELELKQHVDKERLDVLNTLTTFKGFGTMDETEEKEFRLKQMKKHL